MEKVLFRRSFSVMIGTPNLNFVTKKNRWGMSASVRHRTYTRYIYLPKYYIAKPAAHYSSSLYRT